MDAFVQQVEVIEAAEVKVHAALVKKASGQPPFLGSKQLAATRRKGAQP
ncbi:MAG TPA: hypothetical protein PKA16_10150 [Ottowia sp.]|nr:hypothetical protein [Ottowia sp.]HMN21740.1 hypothetical protein [Ottowia sp.]